MGGGDALARAVFVLSATLAASSANGACPPGPAITDEFQPIPWSPVITFRHLLCFFLLLVLAPHPSAPQAAAPELWILVDTRAMTLSVMQDETARRTYSNIAIGRGGATLDKRARDNRTPLGEFRIVRIATDTAFRRIFGLDYPSLAQAERALRENLISAQQFAAIRQALRSGQTPPQNTPLGGYIGIHGIGQGDPGIHEHFHWTNGCIALDNQQIDDLHQWIRLGMRVIVR